IVTGAFELFWLPNFLADIQFTYSYDMYYFIPLLLAFICLGSLTEVLKSNKRRKGSPQLHLPERNAVGRDD
ncbi:unnamed protein product, partial [Didymodactylos carnosus]